MNVKSIVIVAKRAAVSESGKAVISAAKTVGSKLLKGVVAGAGVGAFVAGSKIGYKAASHGLPAVLKPIGDVLDGICAGEPQFTVTFNAVKHEEPVSVDEKHEETSNEEEQG